MVFTGFLTKRGHLFPTWHKRYFTLNGNHLEYFSSEGVDDTYHTMNIYSGSGGDKKGEQIITSSTTIEEANFSSYPGAFALRDIAVEKILYLHADTENEKRAWLKVFETAINDQKKSPLKVSAPAVASKVSSPAPQSNVASPATLTGNSSIAESEEQDVETAGAAAQVAESVPENTAISTLPASPSKKEPESSKETPPPAPQTPLAASPTPPVTESVTVDIAKEDEEVKQESPVAVISKQDSMESVGVAEDEDVVEVEVGVSQAPPEESNDKTDDELDAALYEAVGRGGNTMTYLIFDLMLCSWTLAAWILKREGESGGLYHNRFVWIDTANRELHW